MLQDREKAIAWVLVLIYVDISRLDDGEILKLGIDLQEKLFGGKMDITSLISSEKWPETMKSIQNKIRRFFENYIEPVIREETSRSLRLPDALVYDDRFFFISGQNLLLGEVGSIALEDNAVEKLIVLLGTDPPIKREHFQMCEHCQHWFFGSRAKRFCSPKCNWQFNVQKKRGAKGTKQREAYNLKQRDIMKKRYAEKMKERLGGKVRVGRG
ncbi:MAG: hypothetical protein JW883_12490 [Deltaproteobacteria bacterium]|nr:hypothetical protein [Deltaproteobacteria bacterium]